MILKLLLAASVAAAMTTAATATASQKKSFGKRKTDRHAAYLTVPEAVSAENEETRAINFNDPAAEEYGMDYICV